MSDAWTAEQARLLRDFILRRLEAGGSRTTQQIFVEVERYLGDGFAVSVERTLRRLHKAGEVEDQRWCGDIRWRCARRVCYDGRAEGT